MEFEYDKSTMTKKSFHLRWNNHLQNLQSLFEHLYNEQSLVDVTLSCTDGILYGHKLVLSACSSYFEQVFKDNPCKHPIMILKGIKLHEMKVLLEYMYIGSVDVGEEDLEMLLDTATELQIKGLMRCPDDSLYQTTKLDKKHHSSKDSQNAGSPTSQNSMYINDTRWQAELVMKSSGSKHKDNDPPSIHENIRHNSTEETVTSNDQMMIQKREESRTEYEDLYSNREISETNMQEDFEEASEDESKEFPIDIKEEPTDNLQITYNFQENKISDADELDYFCHICSRGFQNKGSYHRHMLTHSGVKPHRCTFCEQSFLRLSHLQRHIRVHTGERPYSCGQCPKQFSRSDKLRQHYIIQHNNAGGSKTLKPRGRPRKHLDLYPPSTSSGNAPTINTMYPTQSGVKRHCCKFCERSFLRLYNLQQHIKVHTGERPYSCGQCLKQFSRSDKFRQHYITQHNNAGGSKTLKPHGRPRKHLDIYPPSTPTGNVSTIPTIYIF